MRRFLVLALCLAGLGGCNAADLGTGSLRPQPEPETNRFPTLEPAVRAHRDGSTLTLAGTADGNDVLVVVTELRHGAPLQQVATAADASFTATLDSTGETDVQLSPVTAKGAFGFSLLRHVDANGVVTELPEPCVQGSTGLWQLGDVATQGSVVDGALSISNRCDAPVQVAGTQLRIGVAYTLGTTTLPAVLGPGESFEVPVRFTLPAGEATTGPSIYDFLELDVTPAGSGAGFILRVTRGL